MRALRFTERPSPNFDSRARQVDLVVLHYTGMKDGETALARLTDPAPVAGEYPGPWQDASIDPATPLGRASAHYVVDVAGEIFRVVAEANRAWHAGASSWEGEEDVNSCAIGVELVNGGHDYGLPEFADAQIEALIALLADILARHDLHPSRVLAHSDIAPARKMDPGEKFPWKRLAQAGVSIWPEHLAMQAQADIALVQRQLRNFGYGVDETGALDDATRAALAAFQRRFRPARIDGIADAETSMLLAALARNPSKKACPSPLVGEGGSPRSGETDEG